MSLYNMMNGMTAAVFYVLPMLGKRPDDFPRFRDCFMYDDEHPEYDKRIQVYTRVGGGNREDYTDEIATIRAMPTFVDDYDDSFDCTFATFVFNVPEEWREDFAAFCLGGPATCSERYKQMIMETFKNFSDAGKQQLHAAMWPVAAETSTLADEPPKKV